MEKNLEKKICKNFMSNLRGEGRVLELKKEKKACFQKDGFIVESFEFEADTIIDNRYCGRELIIEKMKKINKEDEYVAMWLGDSFSRLDRLDILYALNKCYLALKDNGLLYLTFNKGKEDTIENHSLNTHFQLNELLDFIVFSDFLIFDIDDTDKISIILKK